jgi:catechol 2,3-dioxygenase-like lactoylglutathione lyase family enzyme
MPRPALVPEFYVSSLSESLSFYVDLLGFRIEYERREDRFACISLGDAWMMLEQVDNRAVAQGEELAAGRWITAPLEPPFGRGTNLEIAVQDVEPAAAALAESSYPMVLEPHERHYKIGNATVCFRVLLVADPDGYLIRLAEKK